MVRVISGTAKGIRLKAPRGGETRPTADRIKESLFQVIAAHIPGAAVLDVFAGTGSLGIEALSRGANSAVFIENDRKALACLRENLKRTGMEDRSRLVVSRQLPRRMPASSGPFDVVFADPPYNQGWVGPFLDWLGRVPALTDDALIVIERSNKEELPMSLEKFQLMREMVYDQKVMSLLRGSFGCG